MHTIVIVIFLLPIGFSVGGGSRCNLVDDLGYVEQMHVPLTDQRPFEEAQSINDAKTNEAFPSSLQVFISVVDLLLPPMCCISPDQVAARLTSGTHATVR